MNSTRSVPEAPDIYLPYEAMIVDRIQETENIFTWRLRLKDDARRAVYRFQPGQFNMLYHFGAGEVAMSIVPDPDPELIQHTIHAVGRVTKQMAALGVGDSVGLRGPFGRGWPLEAARHRDVIVLSGGLGAVPVVCVIEHILKQRAQYGRLMILQGVRYASEHIFASRYDAWRHAPDTQVLISASRESDSNWPELRGRITVHLDKLSLRPDNTLVITCGPEGLMQSAADYFVAQGVPETAIYLGLERNMHCGVGHCGHCQMGGVFVCKDGPVFSYASVRNLIGIPGI